MSRTEVFQSVQMEIEFSHITMSFGANDVLHDVSFKVPSGRIFALLGENGAGKSTLMNLLGGSIRPVGGEIFLDGRRTAFRSPNDSIASGIAFIHQELSPVNDLRVYENIFLGRELRRGFGLLDRASMRMEARRILEQLQVDVDENCFMRDLDASHKQIVEISRALLCKARVIIMDEPTTSLAEHEIERLFELVRHLSGQGVSIIFISHKLNEVKELCTDFAVLRNGALVATGAMADVTAADLSELIVGHALAIMTREKPHDYGRELLRVEGLSRQGEFHDVGFSVRAGEILGFTGLLGDGRSELFRTVFGENGPYGGRIWVDGCLYHAHGAAKAVAQGIGYVPSNRKENAVVPDLSVLSNGTLATLREFRRLCFIDKQAQTKAFLVHAEAFRIKFADQGDLIGTLSGGNQQKVILARWLGMNPKILVLDNPTQGVDIGAKQEIYEIIRQVAASNVAVVVLSGEGQEIVRLCHRAIVMYHGVVAGELQGDGLTESNIMKLATGA